MMHIQAQTKAQKGAAEVIENLDDIFMKFLKKFHLITRGVKPCRIIYYRDGVGDGQFQEVRTASVISIYLLLIAILMATGFAN